MKPYVISVYRQTQIRDMIARNPVTGREFVVYSAPTLDGVFNRPAENPVSVYFADDEESADHMAVLLTNQKPGMVVLVSKTTKVYQTNVPTNMKTSVSKYTEKGLLPA